MSESDLIKLYNSASIYLCSSATEGFALPPAEAMACGCAVATTDCGGNRRYAEHEKTALVSDPDDCASLVNNVLRLLSDEDLRVRIAQAGRDRISEFTWEESTQRLTEFIDRYASICSTSKNPEQEASLRSALNEKIPNNNRNCRTKHNSVSSSRIHSIPFLRVVL